MEDGVGPQKSKLYNLDPRENGRYYMLEVTIMSGIFKC
jgi:hypothetical protein